MGPISVSQKLKTQINHAATLLELALQNKHYDTIYRIAWIPQTSKQ